MRNKEFFEATKSLHLIQDELTYTLDMFGDILAEREGYKGLDGMEAIYFYLVHKFSWQPSIVRGMSYDDIKFILSEEMSDWTAPKKL